MRQPNPRMGVIYGNFPHRVAHPRKKLWIIYGSLMEIFDPKKQEIFMNIFGSLMDIFD